MSMMWQALAIDDQYQYAWNGLGDAGGGVVGDTKYSSKKCYQQVLCRGWHGARKGHLGVWTCGHTGRPRDGCREARTIGYGKFYLWV